jgi:3-hydroxyisobutyrate dehydrogenase
MKPRRICFFGLGRMGLPMSANLARAGFEVTGVDPRPATRSAAHAAGLRWRSYLGEVPDGTKLAISMLPSTAVTLEVARSAIPAMPEGSTWVDMGSNPPALSEPLSELARSAGVDLLEAPVGGGPVEAARAGLQLFVGGDAELVAAHEPVFRALADPAKIHHVGPLGHGYLAKLLVNLVWFGQTVAVTEALLLAGRAGLDLTRVTGALPSSAVRGAYVDYAVPALLRGDYLTSYGLAGCVDELDALVELASRLDSPFELSTLVAETYRQALDVFGPVDGELMPAAFLERRAGLVLHEHAQEASAPTRTLD